MGAAEGGHVADVWWRGCEPCPRGGRPQALRGRGLAHSLPSPLRPQVGTATSCQAATQSLRPERGGPCCLLNLGTYRVPLNERGPPLVGLLGSSCRYNRFPAVVALVSLVQNICFPHRTLFPHRPATWAIGRQSCRVTCHLICVSDHKQGRISYSHEED